MGTNYYLHSKPDCECCGRPFEPLLVRIAHLFRVNREPRC